MTELVFFEPKPVTGSILSFIGQLILHGGVPVHTKVYWTWQGRVWMTELTSDAPGLETEIVGWGDGYMIQITPVAFAPGRPSIPDADASKVRKLAESYASIKNGKLLDTACERDWYKTPQGYGGPEYGGCTSNTYAAWILQQICQQKPPKPRGAIGWDAEPMFPGPKK